MAETISHIRTPGQHKQRAPVLSPDRPLFLGSNDDKLERAQARAARAAAIRRKPVQQPADTFPTDSCLGQEQILELFQNCIKLASENKINQKNAWELNLIDHLCDIIKVEEENDIETNFQKRSLRDVAELYCSDSSLQGVQEYRGSSGIETISKICFKAAGISTVLIDDGFILDKMLGIEKHRDFVPFVGSILRIEHLVEEILDETLEGHTHNVSAVCFHPELGIEKHRDFVPFVGSILRIEHLAEETLTN